MRISDWSSDVCSSDLRCGIDVAARKGAALARLAAVAAQIDAVGDAKQLLRWNRPLACRDRHEREGWHHDLLGPAERDAAEKVAAPELAASFLHAEPALDMDVLAAGQQPVRQRRLYGAPVVGRSEEHT